MNDLANVLKNSGNFSCESTEVAPYRTGESLNGGCNVLITRGWPKQYNDHRCVTKEIFHNGRGIIIAPGLVPLSFIGSKSLYSLYGVLDTSIHTLLSSLCIEKVNGYIFQGNSFRNDSRYNSGYICVVNRDSLFSTFDNKTWPYSKADYPEYFVWGSATCLKSRLINPQLDFWCGLYEPWRLVTFLERTGIETYGSARLDRILKDLDAIPELKPFI